MGLRLGHSLPPVRPCRSRGRQLKHSRKKWPAARHQQPTRPTPANAHSAAAIRVHQRPGNTGCDLDGRIVGHLSLTMVRSLRRSCRLLLAVLAFAGVQADARAQTATQQREAAVLQARGGHMAEAQAALRAMLAAGTDDGLVAMDLTALLQRDGKSAEAVAVFEKAAVRIRRTTPCSRRRGPIATWALRRCGACCAPGHAALSGRHGVAADPVPGLERRREGVGSADHPAPARRAARATGRAAAGRGLCLASGGRSLQGHAGLFRGDQGGAGQSRRARSRRRVCCRTWAHHLAPR